MAYRSFGTVINCVDGRTQLPENEFLRSRYNLYIINSVTKINLLLRGINIEYG
jgi:hypothetical protein